MTDVLTVSDLNQELIRMSRLLDEALEELYERSRTWAEAEDRYRHGKSLAFLAAEGTVAERNAHVDKACGELRRASHEAEALKVAALEAVRSRRTQLNALQSMGAGMRTEMEMAGRGTA